MAIRIIGGIVGAGVVAAGAVVVSKCAGAGRRGGRRVAGSRGARWACGGGERAWRAASGWAAPWSARYDPRSPAITGSSPKGGAAAATMLLQASP